MTDERMKFLAQKLVNYSCALKKGEKILIESIGGNDELVRELIKQVYKADGIPFIKLHDKMFDRELLMGANEDQLKLMAEVDSKLMSNMQAYIGVRGGSNASEMADVPYAKLEAYQSLYWHKVHSEIRVRKTKWVVLRYPTPSMAQMANMSTEAFENYYFDVCNLDYAKMDRAMEPLKKLMERTDKVRILDKDTDLTFSIKGMPAIKCSGNMNIPDGEIYTAPVKDSVEGTLCYNTPSIHDGFVFENIKFMFEKGKIVEASANDSKRINDVLNIDEGARYIGEFSFGVHPYITVPMRDTLFDEKICGSFHFTPGSCYDEANNGNNSNLHWDLVKIQTPEYGGGEIYFDGVLIRKDGRFIPGELQELNPENLK